MKKQDPKSKKPDQKEIEAQRAAEELHQMELEKQRIIEEQKKIQGELLPTGLQCIFTEYCIKTTWESENPSQFLFEFIQNYLNRQGLRKNFKKFEIKIINEIVLKNIIFAKNNLKLNDYQSMVLVNILNELFIQNNVKFFKREISKDEFYPIQYKILNTQLQQLQTQQQKTSSPSKDSKEKLNQISQELQQIEKETDKQVQNKKIELEKLLKSFKEKSAMSDFENFKKILQKHFIDQPPDNIRMFDTSILQSIIDYVESGYIDHFGLYIYCLNNKQQEKVEQIQVYVDHPSQQFPLSQATYMGADEIKLRIDAEEYRKEIQQKLEEMEKERRREEELEAQRVEYLRQEEEDRLDEDTQQVLNEKVREAEEFMRKQIIERQKMLDDKFESLSTQKKR